MADYVLHPVFLRFLVLVICVYALLDRRPEIAPLTGWSLAFLWFSIAGFVLLWLTLWSPVVARLLKNKVIGQIYTPVIVVPMVLCAETIILAVAMLSGPDGAGSASQILPYVSRDMAVAVLFDLMHSGYVVHAHPLARIADPSPLPAAAPPAPDLRADLSNPSQSVAPALPTGAPQDEPSERPAFRQGALVRIGPALLPMAGILLVRTEDHYLGVTTRSGKAMHRAKMADIAELHTGLFGMQINRSVWVAYSAVEHVVDADNRQVVVQLVNGDEERISKPRVFAFRQSYAKYLATRPQKA